MKETPCPICREVHGLEETLSFDGKGINSCGMYRARIATFQEGYASLLGPLFAAAPALLEALQYCFPRVHRHLATGDDLEKARAAIALATGK